MATVQPSLFCIFSWGEYFNNLHLICLHKCSELNRKINLNQVFFITDSNVHHFVHPWYTLNPSNPEDKQNKTWISKRGGVACMATCWSLLQHCTHLIRPPRLSLPRPNRLEAQICQVKCTYQGCKQRSATYRNSEGSRPVTFLMFSSTFDSSSLALSKVSWICSILVLAAITAHA